MEPLHVTNGDIVASMLGASSLPGTALSWADALHAGPLALDPARSRRERATFLASSGWGEVDAIEADLVARDERLARAVDQGHPIVLWFEHDLFDQLQLLQILSALAGAPPGQLELIQSNTYLGSLGPHELEHLWPTREAVSETSLEQASRVWDAVCDGDLDRAAEIDADALPYVRLAVRRLAEERAEPSRTKRQQLHALAAGPRTAEAIYLASQAAEEASFLGDTWAFADLAALADDGLVVAADGARLPDVPPRGDAEAFASALLALTPAGRAHV